MTPTDNGPMVGATLLLTSPDEGDGEDVLVAAQPPLDAGEVRELIDLQQKLRQAVTNIAKVIRGQDNLLWLLVATVMAGGHILLVSVPGLAKTLMARALTKALGFGNLFVRIQFTVDTRPADLTGFPYPDPGTRELKFQPGEFVRAHVVVADEINRTVPNTQGALLEAMQERQVTVTAGPLQETYPLPDPFFVIATQNPIEQEGTFPLPEAQLDRFLVSSLLGYPTEAAEEAIIGDDELTTRRALDRVEPAIDVDGVRRIMQLLPRAVRFQPHVTNYIVRLVGATRPGESGFAKNVKVPVPVRPGEKVAPKPLPLDQVIRLGGSPRASQAVRALARIFALLNRNGEGIRRFATPQDVKDAFIPCLRHRIILTAEALAEGITAEDVLKAILDAVPIEKATAPAVKAKRAPLLLRPLVALVRLLARQVEGWGK